MLFDDSDYPRRWPADYASGIRRFCRDQLSNAVHQCDDESTTYDGWFVKSVQKTIPRWKDFAHCTRWRNCAVSSVWYIVFIPVNKPESYTVTFHATVFPLLLTFGVHLCSISNRRSRNACLMMMSMIMKHTKWPKNACFWCLNYYFQKSWWKSYFPCDVFLSFFLFFSFFLA